MREFLRKTNVLKILTSCLKNNLMRFIDSLNEEELDENSSLPVVEN